MKDDLNVPESLAEIWPLPTCPGRKGLAAQMTLPQRARLVTGVRVGTALGVREPLMGAREAAAGGGKWTGQLVERSHGDPEQA